MTLKLFFKSALLQYKHGGLSHGTGKKGFSQGTVVSSPVPDNNTNDFFLDNITLTCSNAAVGIQCL